jgi:hypothetical protein
VLQHGEQILAFQVFSLTLPLKLRNGNFSPQNQKNSKSLTILPTNHVKRLEHSGLASQAQFDPVLLLQHFVEAIEEFELSDRCNELGCFFYCLSALFAEFGDLDQFLKIRGRLLRVLFLGN